MQDVVAGYLHNVGPGGDDLGVVTALVVGWSDRRRGVRGEGTLEWKRVEVVDGRDGGAPGQKDGMAWVHCLYSVLDGRGSWRRSW